MQGQDLDALLTQVDEPFPDACDLSRAGQEDEKVALMAGQALANGGIGAFLALVYGLIGEPTWLLAAFAGVMATVTADTWATELGVLSKQPPRSITTMRPVAPGTSGGISLMGLLASAIGAALIGAVLMLGLAFERGTWQIWIVLAALLGGLAGSLLDSLLGATLQAMYSGPNGETERHRNAHGQPNRLIRGLPWMNNDMVNMLSSLGGGLVAVLVKTMF